jgi:hypothetical protein
MNSDDEFFPEEEDGGEDPYIENAYRVAEDPFADDVFVYEDEIRFETEFNVRDRIGGVIEDELVKTRDMKDPVQRFAAFVQVVTRSMNAQNIVSISRKDLNFVVEKALEVPSARYKNPTAFVLGYWLTRDSDYTELNKEKFNKLVPNLKELEYPIRSYDAVRYSNLWINMEG